MTKELKKGAIIYFIHNEELHVGKIMKEVKNKETENGLFQILTYTNQEIHLDIKQEELHPSFKDADNYFQKMYPGKDIDFDTLMDTVRFLQF